MLRHRARYAAWLLATVAAITCGALSVWSSTRDREPFAPEASVRPSEYVMWAVLTGVCGRTASRGLMLRGDEAVLVGLVRTRRVRWADVAEVELAQRTGSTQPGGRWRVALRMRDGTPRWVPSFVHGAMGYQRSPSSGPATASSTGTSYSTRPRTPRRNWPARTTRCATPGCAREACPGHPHGRTAEGDRPESRRRRAGQDGGAR
ncbi:hypothetical protein EBN88_17430 [Streptomyces triticirhizae]|uniref:PH domain-containing protein n=1 Tax=Streptomyces triticirhizae TaxID=2483353 RepID=A0A3M2LL94_9ACTN|nr:hypothetical protein EBN88_17430 [Streptomyces triticirhizae]